MNFKTQKGRNLRRVANSKKYDIFYAISHIMYIKKEEVDVIKISKEYSVTKGYVQEIIMMCQVCLYSINEHREDIKEDIRLSLWDKQKEVFIQKETK